MCFEVASWGGGSNQSLSKRCFVSLHYPEHESQPHCSLSHVSSQHCSLHSSLFSNSSVDFSDTPVVSLPTCVHPLTCPALTTSSPSFSSSLFPLSSAPTSPPGCFQSFLREEALDFFCSQCHKQISRLEDLSTRLSFLEMTR